MITFYDFTEGRYKWNLLTLKSLNDEFKNYFISHHLQSVNDDHVTLCTETDF